jgi:hypothetical protein
MAARQGPTSDGEGLQARLRGYRFEAARLDVPLRRLEALGQGQESGRSGRAAGGGKKIGRKVAKAIGGANEPPPARPNGQ